MIDIDKLLQGAIDMHLHAGPDVVPSRMDALEAARQYEEKGMRGLVIKNHFYPTSPLAILANQQSSNINVFGSICLDYEIGGLNVHALRISAMLGAKVVWMPTISSANSRSKMTPGLKRGFGLDFEGDGFSILDSDGALLPEVEKILFLIKEHDMVLASGHMSPREILTLFSKARTIGLKKLVVTHPGCVEAVIQPLSPDDQRELVKMGAVLEHTACDVSPSDLNHSPAEIAEAIKAIGAQHCIISSDLGLIVSPHPIEGLRIFIASLLTKGITPDDIELMLKVNPAKLLGLD